MNRQAEARRLYQKWFPGTNVEPQRDYTDKETTRAERLLSSADKRGKSSHIREAETRLNRMYAIDPEDEAKRRKMMGGLRTYESYGND